jgi:hypothetical protein
MKMYGGMKVSFDAYLTSALGGGGEWSVSLPGRLALEKGATGTHWIGGRWAPEPIWTRWRKKKNSFRYHCRESNPGRSARSLDTILTELSRVLKNFSFVSEH